MNHYDLLRVSPKASKKIIKDAYKSLVKKYHPDLYESASEKLWAEDKMKAINEAYETLMDEDKRIQYDKSLDCETVSVNRIASKYPIDLERVISLAIALLYILISALAYGNAALYVIAYLILPLAAIWFSDELGGFVGPFGRHYIDTQSPGCVVKFLGWVLLLLPPIIALIGVNFIE